MVVLGSGALRATQAQRRAAEGSFPDRVGRYELLLPIASGGMATVYLGRAISGFDFEREVAVKLVHSHLRSEDFERELIEEAKLAVMIRHLNVVQTIDVGEDSAGVFLVMDYVEGDALSGVMRALVEQGVVHKGVALRALVDALRGLHAAHELRDPNGAPLGVVHRDFSPQNVLVGVDGVARLADFGIAKAASRLSHTASGVVKGKFGYMAPEQARALQVDRRADVWAGGVMAWEIVCRRRLHPSGNDASTLLAIVNEDAPRTRAFAPDAPSELEDVIASALSRDVRRRVATAEALADAIERAVSGTSLALADAKEVREAVQRIAGPKLAERRRSAVEMRRLRSSMATLAANAPQEATSSPALGQRAASAIDPLDEGDTQRDPPRLITQEITTPLRTAAAPINAAVSSERRSKSSGLVAGVALGVVVAGAASLYLTQAGAKDATRSSAAAAMSAATSVEPSTQGVDVAPTGAPAPAIESVPSAPPVVVQPSASVSPLEVHAAARPGVGKVREARPAATAKPSVTPRSSGILLEDFDSRSPGR